MTDHIETMRLFEATEGTTKLERPEREHLHECEKCQDIFCTFITDVMPLRNYARAG